MSEPVEGPRQEEETVPSDRRPTVETPAARGPVPPDRARTVETPAARPAVMRRDGGSGWWLAVVAGVFLLAFALYQCVAAAEAAGPAVLGRLLAFFHGTLGRGLSLAVLGVSGLALVLLGAWGLRRERGAPAG